LAFLANHLDPVLDGGDTTFNGGGTAFEGGDTAEVLADAAPAADRAALTSTAIDAASDYEPSDILVRFRTDTAAMTSAAVSSPLATTSEAMPLVDGLTDVHLASGVSVEEALAAYRARPDVLYAEPNYRIHTDAIPNDSRFSELWGLDNTGQSSGTADADIDAPEAWNISTGSSNIVVGVIDSGVDYNHPDLAANIWTNPGEIAGNGIDDDGDGFVDDVHGYNFVANNGNPMDDLGHGTHVAGTIGAIGNNGTGVAGVNWHVQIMAIKFISAAGSGTDAAAIGAINYAAMMHSRGVNIKLTSNSWGGGSFSQALQDAIAATQKQGMLFIAAAGNSNVNTDTSPNYPSGYPLDNIISVAASDRNDARASFSNYGATTVDLTAPGVSVLSTTPNNTYSVYSGTSMATPHVAGVAALAWSIAPSATYQQIRDAIFAGVDPNNAFRVGGPTPVATGGRLNALGTLQHLGLIVNSSTPAAGSSVSTPPTSFAITFSAAVDPASVDAIDFTVDGVAANSVGLDSSHKTATFTYNTSPVTVEGQQTMHISAGSIASETTAGQTIAEFNGSFRYDATPLQVVTTSPPVSGGFSLPGPLTYDVNFNEAVDPASVQAGDLVLAGINGAAVNTVTVLNNNTTARFTLSGISSEGTITATIAGLALSDTFGNPNLLPFNFTYFVDNGVVTFPAPLTPELPLGSLIYDRQTTGTVGPTGDADGFTLQLDAGQVLSIVATPTANTLQPAVELRDSAGTLISSATASVAGGRAVVETAPITTAGLYTVTVSGAGGTVGGYLLKVTLNAAEEGEVQGTPLNDTPAQAQSIDGSFVALAPTVGAGQRRAVIGSDGGAGGAFSLANFENGAGGYVINNNSVPGDATGWWHLSTRRGSEAGHSPTTSFYYGNESTGSYDTPGQSNAGNITSPQITLVAGTSVTLSFSYVLVHESTSYDVASVMVSNNGGASFTTIASSKSATQLPPTSTWKTVSFDLSSYAGQTIQLRFDFDTLDSISNVYEGWYVDDVQISSPAKWTDYYSFTAAANDTASIELKNLVGNGATQLFIEDATGHVLAVGGSKANVDSSVNDLVLTAGGTYYARVTGNSAVTYDLVVTKNAEFNIEGNNATAQAQNVFSGLAGLWQYTVGHVGATGDLADVYKINVPAGGTITAQTLTPADGGGQFVNTLDPRLRILDSTGVAVASDENGAADGRNAVVSYNNSGAAAVFYIEVAPTTLVAATSGEYVLQLSGSAVTLPAFQVAATSPATGATVGTAPANLVVTFNDSLLASSVQASDLLIDGSLTAADATMVDGITVRYSLPVLAAGQHVFALAAGSVQDIQGTPLTAFSGTVTIDTSPPKVIATSLTAGATIALGALAYKVTFSKPMKTANLTADDFLLKGILRNVTYSASSYSFDGTGTVLTLNYTNLPEDAYALTLFGGVTGGTNFTDAVGNALDGEFNGTLPSGDGFAGGTFTIGFDIDTDNAAVTFASNLPQGALIYGASVNASISRTDDIDHFTFAIDAGQTVTVLVTPSGTTLQPAVELRDPGNGILASASAAAAGGKVVLQSAAGATAGTYTVGLSGVGGTLGGYTVAVTLNSAVELEGNGGSANDTLVMAQDLSGSFLGLTGLPANVSHAAVQGTMGTVSGNADYYAVQLTAGDTINVALKVLTSGNANVELRNASDVVLTTGISGPTNVTKAISNFTAAATGSYYLRITGDVNVTYDLLVTKNAIFDLEGNDTSAAAESLGAAQSILGYLANGNEDWYLVGADGAGGTLAISTATPSDGPNQFSNVFNPRIELYDPANLKVATGTPGADGRNETIQYQPTSAGSYRLRVISEASTSGEYEVRIDGSVPVASPFQVKTTTPANNAAVIISPASYTIDFNRAYLATSVQAADLLIDGAASATAVTLVDGDTVGFTLPALPPLSNGTHTVSLAGGTVSDIQGTPLAAFSGSFQVDTTAPRIIASSIPQNGTTPTPTITLQLTFSEPMKTTGLNYSLYGRYGSESNTTATFDASGTVLTIVYTGYYGAVPDDNYTFTLFAGGCCAITDLAGNPLDGEFSGTFPTGDGLAGGNFVLNFRGDITTTPYAKAFIAMQPLGSLVYDTLNGGAYQSPNQISPAGDVDTYTLLVDAGQTISGWIDPVNGNLQSTVEVRDPNNNVIATAIPANGNRPTFLQSAPAKTSGIYTISIAGVGNSTGDYFLWLRLNTATENETGGAFGRDDTIATAQNIDSAFATLAGAPSQVQQAAILGLGDTGSPLGPDYYSFSLAAGDTVSFSIAMSYGGGPAGFDVEVRDSNDVVLATSLGGATNVTESIRAFKAPVAGTYYARVISYFSGIEYNLVITKNAEFSLEPNNTTTQAQSLLTPAVNGDQWVAGYAASGEADLYKVTLAAGGTLTAQTYLPAAGNGAFTNSLDPRLRFLDASGNVVATDENSGPDGRNALLSFTNNGAAATFYVEVAPTTIVAATSGEYTVRIKGNSAPLPPFQVVSTTPASGSFVNSAFTLLAVDFNRGYLATSVQPSDLLIDGITTATAVTYVNDGDTVNFSIPALASGQHSFSIAAGAIQDLQGTPVTAFAGTVTIDSTPPTVTATSLAAGGIAPPGALSYQVTFSKAMKVGNLSSDDFSLKSNTLNTTATASSFSFNQAGTVLTLNYSNLPEDAYTLTLVAGATNGLNLTDMAGNALDGEFNGTFPSGNGTAGGDFAVTLNLDTTTVAFPTPLTAKQPLGSLIYDGSTTGVIGLPTDSDSFLLSVNAGQTISVLVSPQLGGLIPAVELRDPAGNLLASGSAATSIAKILQTVPAATSGNYKITVSGANGTTGSYKVAVTLNAALEAENNGGATNNTLASAQDIDASAVTLNTNSTRLAVLGSIGAGPGAGSEDFEAGVLPASFTTYSSNSFGRIRVLAPGGSGNTSKYALLLDSNTDVNYVLNEAVYHVNLSGVTQATLSFSHFQSADEADLLPADFQGHANGDGVAISDDGTHWHTILNAPTNSSWATASIDLAAAVAAAGMKLGTNFQVKFQQYDNYTYPTDGRGYDNIQIQLPDPQDTYQLTLSAGDSLSVAVRSIAGSVASFQLLDSSGAVLGSGGAGPTNFDKVLPGFVVPQNGIYYLAVSGGTGSAYSLLAARNATLDTEANDTSATAQSFNDSTTVLGAINPSGATSFVVAPNAMANMNATGGFLVPFDPPAVGAKSIRYQQIYSKSEFSQAGTITALRFRRYGAAFSSVVADMKINLAYSATTYAAPSTVFANNVGAGVTTVFDGLATLSSTGTVLPQTFDIVINLTTPFAYDPKQGDLLMDIYMRNAPNGSAVECSSNGMPTGHVFAYDVAATTGTTVTAGAVTRFDMAAAPAEDWYSLNVPAAGAVINLQTATPGDGGLQFVNTLDPHLELYGPSNALVASGALLPDGRNESIQYQTLIAGNYRVRVTAENSTTGEYVLSRPLVGGFPVENLAATSPLMEGDITTLSGSFSDPDMASPHTIVVNWGKNEGNTTLNLPEGATSFQATHKYADDVPSGTSSDVVPISITVTNSTSAAFGVGSTTVRINNAPPIIESLAPPAMIAENDTYTLTGTFSDAGILDTHTVLINWGPVEGTTTIKTAGPNPTGATLISLGGGKWQFTASHKYLDDNPTATSSDVYPIGVTVTDDDGGSDNDSTVVTVNNVAPTITGLGAGQSATALVDPVASANALFGRTIVANGSYIVVGSMHNVTQIFSASTGALLRTLPVTGFELAISGSTIAVHSQANEVKLFDAATGILLRTINNPTTDLSGGFGYAVGIYGNTLAVGASTDQNVGVISGAVYLFDVATGNLLHTIYNPSPAFNEHFGESVGIFGTTLVVGAPLKTVGGIEAGAAYLYDAATGNLISTLNNPTPAGDDLFGEQVTISGNKVVVGAYLDDSGGTDCGAAYLFDAATGSLLQTLAEPSPAASDEFGYSLAISGNTIVVGGVDDDTLAMNAGAAFTFDATTGKLLATLNNPVSAANEYFGAAVAISGSGIVVGAPNHDGAATDSGIAYVLNSAAGLVVEEDDSYVLTGTFHDAGTSDTHVIAVHWGGGVNGQPDEGTTTLTTAGPNPLGSSVVSLGGGDWQFTATHRYLDDNPSGTESDSYAIDVTVSDDDGASAASSTSITVTNAAPAITKLAAGRVLVDLTNPNPTPTQGFGDAVAADDRYIVVGSSSAVGISVYDTRTNMLLRTIPSVGVRVAITGSTIVASGAFNGIQLFDASTGSLLRNIENPSTNPNNNFGASLAVSENSLVVGAPADNTGADAAGAVFVFDITTGGLLRTIYNPYPVKFDGFGRLVSIDGDTIAITAAADSVGGIAYLFDKTTGTLLQTMMSPVGGGNFGASIAVSGSRVVVGDPNVDDGATSVGSAYVFDVDTGAILYAVPNPTPDAYDQYGWSVAISADVVAVGSFEDDSAAPDSGAAYVFDTASGALIATLTEPTHRADAVFGARVAVAAGKVFIGAPGWGTSKTDPGGAFVWDVFPRSETVENGTFLLSGTFHDDGTLDTHTISINWGGGPAGQPTEGITVLTTAGPNPPGTSLVSLGNGDWQFTATHLYADDNPSGTSSDDYVVGVTITDDDQGTTQANTTVTVVNVAPTPEITSVSSPRIEGSPISVAGTATDPAGASDPITYAWQVFKEGSAVVFASGGGASFSFTPNDDGAYRLELTASDDDGGSATTSQVISVDNAAPIAGGLSASLDEDGFVPVTLKATDVPADALTCVIVAQPQHGTLSGDLPNVTYHPAADFNGNDTFTYQATDGEAASNVATVSLVVRSVNDPPSFDSLTGNYSAFDENPATHGPALQQHVSGWATKMSVGPANEAGQSLNFIVTNDNHQLFAVQPAVGLDGSLTYTPKPNAQGTAHVTVVLHDSGGGNDTSQSVNLQIEIVKQHPLHNAAEAGVRNGRDVTGATSAMPDGFIVAGDVLAVVNYINAKGSGHVAANIHAGPPYPDVDGDDEVVAQDVIDIINYINSHPGQSEAAHDVASSTVDPAAGSDAPQSGAMAMLVMMPALGQSARESSSESVATDLISLLAADTAAEQFKRRRTLS
jgi:hypothetical protein